MRCVHGQTDRQTDSPIFYKVETYLDHLLMLEIYVIPNFVKIVKAVLEIIKIYVPTYIYIYIYIYTVLARLIISGDIVTIKFEVLSKTPGILQLMENTNQS